MTTPSQSEHNLPWYESLVTRGSTIRGAIENLNRTGLQIVLVVDDNRMLLGAVTDGDIRRALLKGIGLDGVVDDIMIERPMVAPPGMERAAVVELMQANKIHQLPIVDDSNIVVGLHVWDEVMQPKVRENKMVIMAGGLGTRMRPLTETVPKPMLEVSGKPMLEHIIDRAKSEGFNRFVLAINYLGHIVEEYFGDGSRKGVEVEYLRESEPMGTAGAIASMSSAPDMPFLVTNGDVLTDVKYGELLDFHASHNAMATMAIRQYEWRHPFGVVRTEGLDVSGIDEKPLYKTHVNAGIYALEPGCISFLDQGKHCDMPELFDRLRASKGRTIAFPLHEPWVDVGRPTDIARAEDNISEK